MEPHVADIARVIQLSVAPIFLLTGIGTILSALNIRLGRIVDRQRLLLDRLRKGAEEVAATAGEDDAELALLARRIRLIYNAIMLLVLCALLICLLVAAAFLGEFITVDLARVVGSLFIVSMVALAASMAMHLREIFLAINGGQQQL